MRLLDAKGERGPLNPGIDSRVKLIIAGTTLVMVLSSKGPLFPAVITLFGFIMCMRLGMHPRRFMLRFSEPLFIAAVVMLLKLFTSGHEPLFSMDVFGLGLRGYRDGLMEGISIAARITGSVFVVALLSLTTPFAELLYGLSRLGLPKGFIEILMFAYRSIFHLSDHATTIFQAQKNRLGYSSLKRGLLSFGTLAGALAIRAFEQSESMTTAMRQRGYDGEMPRIKHRPLRKIEIALSIVMVALIAAVWGVLWKM